MEAKGIGFKRAPEQVDKEEEKKRRTRERQQAKILQKENEKRVFERIVDDTMLVFPHGLWIQKEFNLLQKPSGSRIREYLETNNPKAFDGLRRNNK